MTVEQTVGVVKEVTAAVFRVRDFSYICTPSEKAVAGIDARDLERNSVSSGPILQAGSCSFKIIVAWSLGHDGSVTDFSMLGIAVQRVNGREDPVIMQLELRLVNRDPCQDIAMRSNIQPLRNTLGWYPSPYAMGREQADGFIPLRSVLDFSNGWLVDDTLTVECKMTVSFSRIETVPYLVGAKPDALADLGNQLGAFLDSGHLTDVVVKVGDESIRAHSAILAARSPVFDAMWSTSMKEQADKEVTITDLEPTAVHRMIRFMYTGALPSELTNDNETISLLEAAHRYQVSVLVELCVVALSSRLTVEVVAERLMVADLAGLESLRRACLMFITSSSGRVAAVQATEGYAKLAQKRPHLALDILATAFPPTTVETIAV
eukprot:CAMPEP_0175221020 /NCGR_PEP_ID=MMETSP0093-20121207/20090_1 /TAXON_ID=311494 /ORGANISM="Alexandrium monilatum, Strain CCMP3105" /LENGTH=377 /DNA_ID=CAMNT_0016514557 /DNA_START=21 /DNA_END=1154 /DNA_ORIENTATION=+